MSESSPNTVIIEGIRTIVNEVYFLPRGLKEGLPIHSMHTKEQAWVVLERLRVVEAIEVVALAEGVVTVVNWGVIVERVVIWEREVAKVEVAKTKVRPEMAVVATAEAMRVEEGAEVAAKVMGVKVVVKAVAGKVEVKAVAVKAMAVMEMVRVEVMRWR